MKRTAAIAVSFMLLFFFNVSGVNAADRFEVTGGTLTISSITTESFNVEDSNWTISLGGSSVFVKNEAVTITDISGTNEGWKFKIGLSDFSNFSQVADPTAFGATLSINVDVEDWLSVRLYDDEALLNELKEGGANLTPTGDNGTPITAQNYSVTNILSGSGDVQAMTVAPGYGAGEYRFYLVYNITLNDWLPDGTIITSSANAGKFAGFSPVTVNNSEQKYQIFAGTYETLITYSVSGNPA